MPPGAKKRKAAKKKKENRNQSNNRSDSASAPTHPHGEDDRESDVGEASRPMSEEIEKDSEVTDPLSMGVVESATRVEKEIQIEDELGEKEETTDQVDEANGANYDGDSSGSSASSSSSDDESHEIKKVQAESTIASVGSEEQADSFTGKSVEPVSDSRTAESGDSVVENMPSANAASHGKGEANAQSIDSTLTTLEQKASATQENEGRSTSPYIASTAAVDNRAQHMEDSVVTQLVAAPSPCPIQKTSWKGCCGLFEVFSAAAA